MNKIAAVLLLLITTFFWGITFTIVKDAVSRVDVFVFLFQRFAIAFSLLLACCLALRRRPARADLRGGAILGSFLFAAFAFQTVALLSTTASNTGFLTGLNVVIVPLLGTLFLRQQVAGTVWLAVLFASVGLFLLCTNGSWSFNHGDILAAVCAVCVALHLLLTSHFSRRSGADIYWLTAFQVGTVAMLSLAAALARGQRVLVFYPEITWALVLCALFATVFAFLVQTSMQRFIGPSHTALIFCTEPVFAALYAYWAAGEKLGAYGLLGAACILIGMVIAEAIPSRVAPAITLSPE